MKKYFFLSVLMLAATTLMAQGIHYSLPYNYIAVEVEYDEVVYTQGPFYQYSERYLGIKDVVLKSETKYELKHITIHTKTIADTAATFLYVAGKGQSGNIVLTPKGILAAYDTEWEAPNHNNNYNDNHNHNSRRIFPEIMPLQEETMMATSTAKMAEGAAKQIYRIREARMNLLTGDVDNLPSDGKAMQLTLKELDKQEAQLVALFKGEVIRTKKTKLFYFAPEQACEDTIIARFSQFNGVVEADDLSGEPIYMSVVPQLRTIEADPKAKPATNAQLRYRLPGQAEVEVTYGEQVSTKTLTISQLGTVVALPLNSMQKHILFDTKTGGISHIQ